MSDYVIPIVFLLALVFSLVKRKDAYGAFTQGASKAIDLVCRIFPFLLASLVAVELFSASGAAKALGTFTAPFFAFFGIPSQLCELLVVRPVSGAGALGVLGKIFSQYGADSYIGKCASVIYGSSETVFYVAAVYFSKTNIRKTSYAIPVALLCTFAGYVLGCFLLRFF